MQKESIRWISGARKQTEEEKDKPEQGGGGDMLILDRGYSLAKLPRFFEGAEKFG